MAPIRIDSASRRQLPATAGNELGDEVSDDRLDRFEYTYALKGTNTAVLVVTYQAGRFDEYDLTFSNGAQGDFVRREFKNGLLKDTDRGSFSAWGVPPDTSGTGNYPPPTGGTMPQSTLAGLTYTFGISETPDRLVFSSETIGTEFGDDLGDHEPNSFSYSYWVTGEHTALLVIHFKADKWDEYALTFAEGNTGSLVLRKIRKGNLDQTKTGTFQGIPTVNP